MAMHIDLALEAIGPDHTRLPNGVSFEERNENGISVTRIRIDDKADATSIGKEPGLYTTVTVSPFHRITSDYEAEAMAIGKEIAGMLPEGDVLVVGLGNASITPDALGPAVTKLIFTTRHLQEIFAQMDGMPSLRRVSAIAPGVLGQTGVESAEIVHALVKEIKPNAVIVIDALASRELSRLGTTVQISDSGIAPGSGVGNHRQALDSRSLGIPVIAVGVPTVIDIRLTAPATPLAEDQSQMLVTPREIDSLIQNAAKALSYGLNLALQPNLSLAELIALVS